jgi:hypothetical protein
MIHFSTFFITTCHQTITTSIRCRGKLLLLPATIAMTKMIEVLLHTSLHQSFTGELGEALTATMSQPPCLPQCDCCIIVVSLDVHPKGNNDN